MSDFYVRLKHAIGDRGYEVVMRRSVQTVILFEANRCLNDKLRALRPFQRKLAFHDQCIALLDGADFITARHKEEIMWRTGTSKEAMNAEIAWKRMKIIEKEMEKLAARIRPFHDEAATHEDACNAFVQAQYEALSGRKDTPHPEHWEHAHNNMIMCYRIYFRDGQMDPTFPSPVLVKEIVVPAEKPVKHPESYSFLSMDAGDSQADAENAALTVTVPHPHPHPAPHIPQHDVNDSEVAELVGGFEVGENRRSVLKEVRDHLELLKEFEGVISDEEIKKRKRDLFLALPPAPPPTKSVRSDGMMSPVKTSTI